MHTSVYRRLRQVFLRILASNVYAAHQHWPRRYKSAAGSTSMKRFFSLDFISRSPTSPSFMLQLSRAKERWRIFSGTWRRKWRMKSMRGWEGRSTSPFAIIKGGWIILKCVMRSSHGSVVRYSMWDLRPNTVRWDQEADSFDWFKEAARFLVSSKCSERRHLSCDHLTPRQWKLLINQLVYGSPHHIHTVM